MIGSLLGITLLFMLCIPIIMYTISEILEGISKGKEEEEKEKNK